MTVFTRSKMTALLKPKVNKVTGEYPQTPSEWKGYFHESESKMAYERMVQTRRFSYGAMKDEGGQFKSATGAGQTYETTFKNQEFGLTFAITRTAVADNLYAREFNLGVSDLMDAMHNLKNLIAASYIINGFPAGTIGVSSSVLADGKTLFAPDHPIADNKSFSNFVDAGLNETSLEAAKLVLQKMKNEAGVFCPVDPEALHITPDLEWTAERLMKSQLRPGTANNDTNTIPGFLSKLVVNKWLSSTDLKPWFITSSVNKKGNSLVLFQREKMQNSITIDPSTWNIITTVFERYCLGAHDPRGVVGGYNR